MSATEELIAAEVGKMSLDEKKASIAESVSSSSSSSSSSSDGCNCVKHHACCKQVFPGAGVGFPAPVPYLIPYWGAFPPPAYYHGCLPKCCNVPCCQAAKLKPRKASKAPEPPKETAEEVKCKCCKEGKCACCKSGKECGKDDDDSDKSEKSGDEEGDGEEEDGDGEDE